MNLNNRFWTYYSLPILGACILIFVGCWSLADRFFIPEYPNLDVDCFEDEYDLSEIQTGLRATTKGQNLDELHISEFDTPITSINAVFGNIHNPVFAPNYTLLLFSEMGPPFHEVSIVRACDMKTGQQKFYIKDLPYVVDRISFSPMVALSKYISMIGGRGNIVRAQVRS